MTDLENRGLIFLDAGFTLLHPHPSVGHFYALLANGHGIKVDPKALDRAFYAAWKLCKVDHPAHPEVPYGITLEESHQFWKGVVTQTFEIAGFTPPDGDEYYQRVFDLFSTSECWSLYPDVLDGLDFARKNGVSLAILSNWDRRLAMVVKDFGLSERFEMVITSSEAGHEKPSAGIFSHGEERARALGYERFAIIGDDIEADARGGREAGWNVCLLKRKDDPSEGSSFPTAPTLQEAIEEIERQWEA
ncbi:MAG: HAD-IA family hydrolase [Candidatus Sumerlaeia bacterium]|nr:HAD-IA family hydrolase [Candidatus Sumerlaeia bacterium]